MQETTLNKRTHRLESEMQLVASNMMISFDNEDEGTDGERLHQKQVRHGDSGKGPSDVISKVYALQTSDTMSETAEVSESDSDFDSDESYSGIPYPCPNLSGRATIPTKYSNENKTEEVKRVALFSSALCLDEKDSPYIESAVKRRSSWTRWFCLLTISLAVLLFCRLCMEQFSACLPEHLIASGRESVYVPGAGFSGFWFTLGRLQSIEEPEANDYYCFSAGCLGVVASLRNFTVDETLDIALNIQQRWKTGQIKRHDVVGEFVDTLVNTTSSTRSNLRSVEESRVLERLHVITSVKDKWFGMKTQIRSPRNSEELSEMLLQTTWIPFAVGHSLWHTDSKTGTNHMDGAFTMPFHPKTTYNLGLPPSPDILLNVVNVNLRLEKVKQFWKDGFAYGV